MARTSVSPQAAERQPGPQSGVWHVLFYLVGLGVGVGMALLVAHQLAGIGGGLHSGSPLVHEVLALDAGLAAGGAGSSAVALSLAMVACATGAAAALLAGAVAAIWAAHRRTAHRLTTFGMWLALLVCFAAMLPAVGYPFGEPHDIGPGRFEWHPAPKALAVAAAGGLLLSSITSHRFRRADGRR